MRVLLVGPELEENLSIRYLSAALLAAGHDANIAVFNAVEDAAGVLQAARGADLVGLSMCFQVRAREFLQLARQIKADNPGLRIIAGGHFASCAAEPLLREHPEIDLIVIHEGEQTIVEIANAGEALAERLPHIRGIVWRKGPDLCINPPRPAVEDLDTLPTPDRRGRAFMLAGVRTAYILGSRGCMESCAYCCITTLHRLAPGKRFRQRDPEKVADEMARLYHDQGVRQFAFHDDTFLVSSAERNHARIDALQKALQSRGVCDIAFTMKCRPADVEPTLFARLRDMGLVRLFLGIENSTERGLKCLNRRQTVADEQRALQVCAQLGISAQFTILIFHPDATVQTVRQDLAFMRRQADSPLNFCRAEIYAGTPLEQRMIQEGRARGSYMARSYALLDPAADLACREALRIFADRCWNARGLVNMAIGLNHLLAAACRFNSGKPLAALRARTRAWHRLVNSSTLDLFEQIVDRCEQLHSAADPLPAQAFEDIEQTERSTRSLLLKQLNELRAELSSLTRSPAAAASSARNLPQRSRLPAAASIAAAAIVAISAAGCDEPEEFGSSEMAAPAVDAGDGSSDAVADVGISEAALPPVDGGDAAEDIGMSEMSAPPVDGGDAAEDIGMSEMSAPPVDGGDGGNG
jgi:anaerobic magnesium-protoporphyrin IX monomethyl ester cyclase